MSAHKDGLPLPLFPLQAVLFPGGILPLRIFETRYLDMIAQCLRESRGFGVVGIKEGGETGDASFHAIGTEAEIVDWSQGKDGLLGIRVKGLQRFEIASTRRGTDGLYLAQVVRLAPEPRVQLPVEYQHMASVVAAVLEKLTAYASYIEEDYEDATWVGYRLAEIIGMPLDARQALLEMDDPIARLDQLSARLEE
jgi:Lon protease-like protein